MRVLNNAFERSMETEEHAVIPLAGGIKQHGYQCSMIWGATLAAGAQAYRLFGSGPQAETMAIIAAQRLVEAFRDLNNDINCIERTGIDKSSTAMQMFIYFFIKGGTIGCLRMAIRYGKKAFGEINTAFSEKNIETSSPPISCSTILAQKMGATDEQSVMAAGFAGGIGLCGGACGALGAAIWIIGINTQKERDVDNLWNDKTFNAKVDDLIDRFLKITDYEFECSEIAGRRFDSIDDYTGYLSNGGCLKIIDVLATPI